MLPSTPDPTRPHMAPSAPTEIDAVDPSSSSSSPPDERAATFAGGSSATGAPVLGGVFESVKRNDPFDTYVHEALHEEPCDLEIRDFSLWYGEKQALFSCSLRVPRGKVTALVGPSGCGKSTLLRSVNRMNDLVEGVRVAGEMRVNDQLIYGRGIDVIQLRKSIGMVFQKPNPFPMSIYENVVYSLRIDGVRDRRVLDDVCEKSLRGAGLWDEVKDRLSDSGLGLSGGQQQRLCIARAISGEPDILLLDEPCSALDPIATSKIEDLLSELKGRYTLLMVTHNMQQASRASDYTAFMYLGRMVEFGPTKDIFVLPKLQETEDYVTGRFG